MRANPLLSSMSWTLNGTTVDLIAGGFTVTNDGVTSVLRARKVVRGVHGGVYECTATSPIYNSSSKVFNVIVTGQFSCSTLCVVTNRNFKGFDGFIWYFIASWFVQSAHVTQSVIIFHLVCRKDPEVPTDAADSGGGGCVPHHSSGRSFTMEENR